MTPKELTAIELWLGDWSGLDICDHVANKVHTEARGHIALLCAALRDRNAEVRRLRKALKPFAEAGSMFLPAGPSDRSCYVSTSDEEPIGVRRVWETTPLTIGDLRRAAKAREK